MKVACCILLRVAAAKKVKSSIDHNTSLHANRWQKCVGASTRQITVGTLCEQSLVLLGTAFCCRGAWVKDSSMLQYSVELSTHSHQATSAMCLTSEKWPRSCFSLWSLVSLGLWQNDSTAAIPAALEIASCSHASRCIRHMSNTFL